MPKMTTFQAKTIEQTNLLTDPFGLTVLSTLKADKFLSAQEISKQADEDIELIEEYLNLFFEQGMINKEIKDNMTKYAKKAE